MKKRAKRPRGGASILCPRCASPSHVTETRRMGRSTVGRLRRCLGRVPHVFFTEELVKQMPENLETDFRRPQP